MHTTTICIRGMIHILNNTTQPSLQNIEVLGISRVVVTVMETNALMAPMYTTSRGCRIAMIAAMMKVSSPSSVTRICTMYTAILHNM